MIKKIIDASVGIFIEIFAIYLVLFLCYLISVFFTAYPKNLN